ncbi:MAG: phasin family protein [Simplicispira sp.]|nr:phasin family protein [Simplicispira sp.]
MVKKLQKLNSEKKNAGILLSSAVKDSAQQIWLAGLGAFSKAQEEGNKVFEALVKEGLSMQRKTQTAAEEKISETTSRMTSIASDIGSRAAGKWDKLETIFEDRVAKAMASLGVPSAHDLQALSARISALEQSLAKTAGAAKTSVRRATKAPSPSAAPPATKAARKSTKPTADAAPAAAKAAAKKPAAKARAERAPRSSQATEATAPPEAAATGNSAA